MYSWPLGSRSRASSGATLAGIPELPSVISPSSKLDNIRRRRGNESPLFADKLEEKSSFEKPTRNQLLGSSERSPESGVKLSLNSPSPELVSSKAYKQAAGVTKVKEQISTEDLQPLNSPEREFKVECMHSITFVQNAMDFFKSPEWDLNFDAIDIIRRLVVYHTDIVINSAYSVLICVIGSGETC